MKRTLRLDYPPIVVNQPVIYHLVDQFHLTVNILRAQVQPEEGWLIIEVDGSPEAITSATGWLREQGLDVSEES
jgi:L-aspartate semialdehyde sulfurtransferase ferredoxin